MKKKRLRAECNALCKAQDGPGPKWTSVCEQKKLKGETMQKKGILGFEPQTCWIDARYEDHRDTSALVIIEGLGPT